jgi:hypothetical protein
MLPGPLDLVTPKNHRVGRHLARGPKHHRDGAVLVRDRISLRPLQRAAQQPRQQPYKPRSKYLGPIQNEGRSLIA